MRRVDYEPVPRKVTLVQVKR